MFGFRKEMRMPTPSEALPGRSQPLPTAERHFVNQQALKGPYPEGNETALVGMGLFLGRRASVLVASWRPCNRRGLCGGYYT
jgi:peptide-methionine (S)-S-oxide reductase